nr:Mpo1-like protein [Bradyrhizobium septentrionale]
MCRRRKHNGRGERLLSSYFRRLLADYVEYHRAPWNCAMHVVGILSLFLATSLPLDLWFITVLGIQINMAFIALVPVLIFWLVLDLELGAMILGIVIALLAVTTMILDHPTTVGMWSLTAVLTVIGVSSLIIGHLVFERRRPAMVDNPTHLLVGPMFVMAKLVVALGFRPDLRTIVGNPCQASPR